MMNAAQLLMSVTNRILRKMVFALAVVCTLIAVGLYPMQAQMFSVLHNFSGGGDGANPYAGVTVGPGGVLYGTASAEGAHGYGLVFKLRRVNSAWVLSPIYEFTGSDGDNPLGGVVIGPNGALYGTTFEGGNANYGVVFELKPPPTPCKAILCFWNETLLHSFTGPPDGTNPLIENLAFDQAGDIYGTTGNGGMYGYGVVFELTLSGGQWTETILHEFESVDGKSPYAGVVLDRAGNVYGTTVFGGGVAGGCGYGCGTAYQLMPSNQGWLENVVVSFDQTDASYPEGNLVIDGSGNLYGTTSQGGQNGYGVVFKLAPSDGSFAYSVLYSFSSYCDSQSGLAMDAAGGLFGVCSRGGANQDGWIYELTNCSESCTLVNLHDFSGSDGWNPYGSPVLDPNGNLYGTTIFGGTGDCTSGCGVVWEIAGASTVSRR